VFVRRTIGEGRRAAQENNRAGVASAVERAIYASVEEGLGIRARAVLRDRLELTLVEQGADAALARDTVSLLDLCETLKFGGTPDDDLPAILERAASVSDRLVRVDRRARPKEAA
jgi:hypothetical protein